MKIKQLVHVRNMVFRTAAIEAIKLALEDAEYYPAIYVYVEKDCHIVDFDTPAEAQAAFVKLATDWADYMNTQ